MSAEEKIKTLVHEFFEEAWGKGNVYAVDDIFFGTVCTTSCALVCFYTTARPSARSGAQDLARAGGLVRLEKLLDLVEDP